MTPVIFLPVYLVGLHSLQTAIPRTIANPSNSDTQFLNHVDQVVNASSSYGFNQFLLSTINTFSNYLNNYISSIKPIVPLISETKIVSNTPLLTRLLNIKGSFKTNELYNDTGFYCYNQSIISRRVASGTSGTSGTSGPSLNSPNSLYHNNLLPSHKIPMSPISSALQSKNQEILDLKIQLSNTEAALLDSKFPSL